MRRKAFSMIELVFVIVVIGILASIAIPKLSATKQDAVKTKAKANLHTCITDIGNLYITKGEIKESDINSNQSCKDVNNYSKDTVKLIDSKSIKVNNSLSEFSEFNSKYTFGGTQISY